MSSETAVKQPQTARPKQKSAYNLHGFKVLIVEDYPFMAELITSMLRELGVGNMLVANSGKEAQEMVLMFNSDPGSRNHIDLVITDWLMPDGNGIEFMNWIRGHKKDEIRFLPVILCSAYASEDVVVEGRDNGANEVLVKPVSGDRLAKRIVYTIDNPRPFIKAPDFFGPDRRRQDKKFEGEDKRKTTAEEIKEYHEQL